MLNHKTKIVPAVLIAFASLVSFREYCSFIDLDSCKIYYDDAVEQDISEDSLTDENSSDEELSGESVESIPPLICNIKKECDNGENTVTVKNGDTLSSILNSLGVGLIEVDNICKKISKIHNLKTLQVGQQLSIKLTQDSNPTLLQMEFNNRSGDTIIIFKKDNGFKISIKKRELVTELKCAAFFIEKNFSSASSIAGIPRNVLSEASRILSSVVNSKNLRPGDSFELVYEEKRDAITGQIVGKRDLKYVSAKTKNKTHKVYNLGNNLYVNEKGESVKKEMLVVPLKCRTTRVTSKFGYRKHPILGVLKYHQGVDYAAKYGSPVCAAANGVVTSAGRKGNYGLYLKIRHSNGFETAYAHLSSINVRVGSFVSQGSIVGRVGCSGRVTGAHLHHEVILNKRHVDPQRYHTIGSMKVSGKNLAKFNKMKKEYANKLSEYKTQKVT